MLCKVEVMLSKVEAHVPGFLNLQKKLQASKTDVVEMLTYMEKQVTMPNPFSKVR